MNDLVYLANKKRTTRIRQLNDAFRSTFLGGLVTLTAGVEALEPTLKAQVLNAVRSFDDSAFDKSNDPHDEHDFVAFELTGQTYFAKVDYYNRDMSAGSEDPSDPKKTTRVLTIMRADEY